MEGSEITRRLKYLTKNQKTGVKFTSVFVLSEDMKQIRTFLYCIYQGITLKYAMTMTAATR